MKTLQWRTEQRRISDLIPLEINPRKISEEKLEQLKKNMERFNIVEIPVCDIDNTLLTYHQRLKALIALGRGEELIDVRLPDRKLTEEEILEYNIIANTHSGAFDMDIFDEHFGAIDLESIGVSMADLNFEVKLEEYLLQQKEERRARIEAALEDEYEIPDDIQTDIVEGDLFEIGRHRLLCGNARTWDHVEKLMNGTVADCCVTDPPYNVAYVGKTKDALTIKGDRMTSAEFYQLLYDAFINVYGAIKPGGGLYVFHADTEGENFRKAFRTAGMKLSGCLVWVKQKMVMGRSDYHWKHEPILYGWKRGMSHRWFSDRCQTTVLEFDKPDRSSTHPTMKPIPLLAYLLENSSLAGESIVDLFGGSGSLMVTCQQMDRTAYMMELDPKFCQVIVDRMKALDTSIVILRNGNPI